MSGAQQQPEAEETEMRLKPSEVRIVNAIRTLQPQSRIHISKQENGDLDVQTNDRIRGAGQSRPTLEGGATAHRVTLRD
jgi:hypothetical protein